MVSSLISRCVSWQASQALPGRDNAATEPSLRTFRCDGVLKEVICTLSRQEWRRKVVEVYTRQALAERLHAAARLDAICSQSGRQPVDATLLRSAAPFEGFTSNEINP